MSNDWSSGYQAWLDAHPDADMDTKMKVYNQCWGRFDSDKFCEHYNHLSVEEWEDVIVDMMNKGYDIRSVLCYKKRDGLDFDVSHYDEILDPLLVVDGSKDFFYFGMLDGPYAIFGQEKLDMQKSVVDRYKQFELPIPQYWRNLLWT